MRWESSCYRSLVDIDRVPTLLLNVTNIKTVSIIDLGQVEVTG